MTNNNTFIKQTIPILTLHNFHVRKTKSLYHSTLYLNCCVIRLRLLQCDLRTRLRRCDYDYARYFFATKREGGSQVAPLRSLRLTLLINVREIRKI